MRISKTRQIVGFNTNDFTPLCYYSLSVNFCTKWIVRTSWINSHYVNIWVLFLDLALVEYCTKWIRIMRGRGVHVIPAWLLWAEIKCTVHVTLPQLFINQLKPVDNRHFKILKELTVLIYIQYQQDTTCRNLSKEMTLLCLVLHPNTNIIKWLGSKEIQEQMKPVFLKEVMLLNTGKLNLAMLEL